MLLRENYYFNHLQKRVNVRIKSEKWNQYLTKSLVVPQHLTVRESVKLLNESLGDIEITSIKTDRVVCLIDPQSKVGENMRNIIDLNWHDGIEYSVEIFYSRKKSMHFFVVADYKTTKEEIRQLMSFLCLDKYQISIDEIGNCWVKRD